MKNNNFDRTGTNKKSKPGYAEKKLFLECWKICIDIPVINYLMGQGNVKAHPCDPGLDKDKWTDGKEQFWMEKYILRLEGTEHLCCI